MDLVISLFLLLTISEQKPPVDLENVPLPISRCLQASPKNLEISRRMNPFYLRGDFNGDGRSDFVVLVQDRKSEKAGFAFCFDRSTGAHVVGAGVPIALEGGVKGDDLAVFNVWGVAAAWSKSPKRDAVYLEQAESGSGMLIWNGQKIIWQQTSI